MNEYEELMIIDSGYHVRGLFSYIFQVIGNLHIFDVQNKFSLVDLHTTPYNEPSKGNNVWTYYFKQIPTTKKEDLHLFKKINRNVWFDNRLDISPIVDEETRNRCNKLIKKYIIIKDHILDKTNDFLKNTIRTENYASIHYRGTDHIKDEGGVEKQVYFDSISEIIDTYDKILICSDEQQFINDVLQKFNPDKIVYYPSFRSKNNEPIHFNNSEYKYKSGEDVLIESILMSKSKFLIRTISGVTQFSLCLNLDLKYKNIDEQFYEQYRKKYNFK